MRNVVIPLAQLLQLLDIGRTPADKSDANRHRRRRRRRL